MRDGDQINSLRMSALLILRDSSLRQSDMERAVAVQREIVERTARLAGPLAGPHDPAVADARAELARMIMSASSRVAAA